jgi:hypothetical protein
VIAAKALLIAEPRDVRDETTRRRAMNLNQT